MKKIILTSTALLALAAASYAQLIQQNGQQQFARQNQVGINQNGTIQQLQNATPALNGVNYGNYAITFQGTPQNNGINFLLIQQNDGSQGNRAGISQSGGPDLDATIQQNGGVDGLSGGASSTSATQGARGEDGNFAGILQTGSQSAVTIAQNNNSRRNSAETYQNGSNNVARTSQSNNSVSNNAFVFQGFMGQNIIGAQITGSTARIGQGRGSSGETNPGGGASEAIVSTAVITQTASNAKAFIDQGGEFNSSGSTAGRASGADARINQSAINTETSVVQGLSGGEAVGSRVIVNQTSANQIAVIGQASGVGSSDNNSIATINQTSTTSGVAGNVASIFQAQGGGSTDSDQATINQTTGVANSRVSIFQGMGTGSYSSGDVATINQAGNTTAASIFQNIAGGGGESNGRNNTATITQAAGVVGSLNTSGLARITQGYSQNGSSIQVNRNTATITQTTGAGLRAAIIQGASAGTPLTDAATVAIPAGQTTALQGGAVTIAGTISNDNTATINQISGDNHNANIFQTGRFNQAAITQANGNGSRALVVQTSNSERAQAIINQTASGASNNQATILQFAGSNADGRGSFGNQAIINQTVGSNNIALLQQGTQAPMMGQPASSNDNFAQVTQNGSSNQARFLQIGNNNFVDITQNGNNNRILNGAGVAGSFGAQIGYNNRLSLVQNGGSVGLTFSYTQIGNNNTQEVVQNLNP